MPILTYIDTALWNRKSTNPPPASFPIFSASSNVSGEKSKQFIIPLPSAPAKDTSARASFTGTENENRLYLTTACIEVGGVEVLSLMRQILDGILVSDAVAVQ